MFRIGFSFKNVVVNVMSLFRKVDNNNYFNFKNINSNTFIGKNKKTGFIILKSCFSTTSINFVTNIKNNDHFLTFCAKGKLEEAFDIFSKNQNERNFRTLITACGKNGNINVAYKIFELIKQNKLNHFEISSITYDLLIQAFSKKKMSQNAVEIYDFMTKKGLKPNSFTFNYLLNSSPNFQLLKQIHEEMNKYGIQMNIYLTTSLIASYSECGSLDFAISLFDQIQKKDLVTYIAMIKGCIRNKSYEKALDYFDKMEKNGLQSNDVVYNLVLKACAETQNLALGKEIHDKILKFGIENVEINNTLISMYGKCNELDRALLIFNEIQKKDLITYTTIIKGFIQSEKYDGALFCYEDMKKKGFNPNVAVYNLMLKLCAETENLALGKEIRYQIHNDDHTILGIELQNSLLNFFGKCNQLEESLAIFDTMNERDLITYNALLSVLISNEKYESVLYYYNKMKQEGFMPDYITYLLMLKYCGDITDVKLGEQISNQISKDSSIKNNIKIQTSLIAMHSKSSFLEKAIKIFDQIKEKNTGSYNAMIASYSKHGKAKEAIQLFEKMIQNSKLIPNGKTFLSLLIGCSHCGLIDQAKYYLKLMKEKYNIELTIEHHNIMIDALSRQGHLKEAEEYVTQLKLQNIKINVKKRFKKKKIFLSPKKKKN